MNRVLSSPSLSTEGRKSCNLWYVINTGMRGCWRGCSLFTNGGSYEIFYTRKYRSPTHARKTISCKFFQGKRKKEERIFKKGKKHASKLPPHLKRLDMKISVGQAYIYIYISIKYSRNERQTFDYININNRECLRANLLDLVSGKEKLASIAAPPDTERNTIITVAGNWNSGKRWTFPR